MTEFDERFNGFGVPVTVTHSFHLVGELGHSLSENSLNDLSAVEGEWTYRMLVRGVRSLAVPWRPCRAVATCCG
jgi:hypothetical protein